MVLIVCTWPLISHLSLTFMQSILSDLIFFPKNTFFQLVQSTWIVFMFSFAFISVGLLFWSSNWSTVLKSCFFLTSKHNLTLRPTYSSSRHSYCSYFTVISKFSLFQVVKWYTILIYSTPLLLNVVYHFNRKTCNLVVVEH